MSLIIAFEGLDCSFKKTQSQMLTYDLKKMDYKVVRESFPRYTTEIGAIIYKVLHGEYGDIDSLPCQFIDDLYSLDRAVSWYRDIKNKYNEEDSIIVFDRWIYSNCIYGPARMKSRNPDITDVELKNLMMNYIVKEVHQYRLPSPDIVLHMDMPMDITVKLLAKKKNKDFNELDLDFMSKVFEVSDLFYKNLMKDNPNIYHIRCVDDYKDILTRETIHKDIMDIIINKYLNYKEN